MVVKEQPDHGTSDFGFVGGVLALDFVNTGSHRVVGPFKERLDDYGELVRFAEEAVAIDQAEGEVLRSMANADAHEAADVVGAARELREAIYRAFSARGRGENANAGDLEVISRHYADAVRHQHLANTPDGFQFAWPDPPVSLAQVLWPMAVSATELLVSDDVARVKECATDNCNWLFLDASKNKSRRWCEMKECGNRAKARRHYARKKTS
jgi:predicted RNA-binding Zn ribbon-like protein